jgi:hypothetical protein
MTGPSALLVTKSSATLAQAEGLICAIARTHQEMVKFQAHDPEYERVLGFFNRVLALLPSTPDDLILTEKRRMSLWCANRINPSPKPRKCVSIPTRCFTCWHEDDFDHDFAGKHFWYREIGEDGYPLCVTVEPYILAKGVKPVWDTIITCRRICNFQIRGHLKWVEPGDYCIIWLLWFIAGKDCPPSTQPFPQAWIPKSPPSNTIFERSFTSDQGSYTKDSGWCYPWGLRCSAGQARNPNSFLHEEVDVDKDPCIPGQLLCQGYQEQVISSRLWNNLRNTGWCEVKGPRVTVGNTGDLFLLISRDFERKWIGGVSFGGVKLIPIS